MATMILNCDLSIRNDNDIMLKDLYIIGGFKEMPSIEESISNLEQAIKAFEKYEIEIGLCIKYHNHPL